MRYAQGITRYAREMMRYARGIMRHAKGMMHHARGMMRYARGIMRYARGMMRYSLGIMRYAQWIMRYARGMKRYAQGIMNYARGMKRYAQGIVHHARGMMRYARYFSCPNTPPLFLHPKTAPEGPVPGCKDKEGYLGRKVAITPPLPIWPGKPYVFHTRGGGSSATGGTIPYHTIPAPPPLV